MPVHGIHARHKSKPAALVGAINLKGLRVLVVLAKSLWIGQALHPPEPKKLEELISLMSGLRPSLSGSKSGPRFMMSLGVLGSHRCCLVLLQGLGSEWLS